jgi:hypothetical protein
LVPVANRGTNANHPHLYAMGNSLDPSFRSLSIICKTFVQGRYQHMHLRGCAVIPRASAAACTLAVMAFHGTLWPSRVLGRCMCSSLQVVNFYRTGAPDANRPRGHWGIGNTRG